MSYSTLLPTRRKFNSKPKELIINIHCKDMSNTTNNKSETTEVLNLLTGTKELITIKHWA